MKVLGDKIVVEPMPESDTTEGGIVLPEQSRNQSLVKGTVTHTGPGRVLEGVGNVLPMTVKVGDVVVFGKNVGIEIFNNCKIMREHEILYIED